MSYKIINPTTNPDRVGPGGVIIPGTPDQKIEFPTGEGTVALTSQITQGGGGISGTSYIYVSGSGTDTQNATELQAAYDTAKTMSPSATNRITIIAGPGNYNFGSTEFTMDAQYIDFVSLDGNISVIFNSSNASGTINVTANDVFVKGVDVSPSNKTFIIGDSLNLLVLENCKGGEFSFGGDSTYGGNPIVVSGTFIGCEGDANSFAGYGTASGVFTDCIAFNGGGFGSIASGTFTNCIGYGGCFGTGGAASGTFRNCIAYGSSCFGSGGPASGVFIDCQSGNNSFGVFYNATGTFINCRAGDYSFGGGDGDNPEVIASGTFRNCTAGDYSFGGSAGTSSGTFTNCTAGDYSFGGISSGTFTNCSGGIGSFSLYGQSSGIFIGCVGGDSSFSGGWYATSSGVFTNCIGGQYSFGFNGIANGSFTGCVGGSGSFGGSGDGETGYLTGNLYYCRLTTGSFQTVSGGGRTYYCVDGDGNVNNQ